MGKKKSDSKQQKSSPLFYIVLAFVVALVGILLASTFTDITGEALAVSPFTVQQESTETSTFTELIQGTAGFTTATVTITDKRVYYTITLDKDNHLINLKEGVIEKPDFTVSLDYYTLLASQYKEISLEEAIATSKIKFSSPNPVSLKQLDAVISAIDITELS